MASPAATGYPHDAVARRLRSASYRYRSGEKPGMPAAVCGSVDDEARANLPADWECGGGGSGVAIGVKSPQRKAQREVVVKVYVV